MNISVKLGERSYDIVCAESYHRLPHHLKTLGLSHYGWVISHATLLRRYGANLLAPLRRSGWTVQTLAIPESESSKTLATVQRMLQQLARHPSMRTPTLFAFGGGVVGDVAGFVAAVFKRGVPYVQLPTTLLAQVDSAIGGKVGVDLPRAKNFIGAFYQPRLVYNNLSLLRSLPPRQRRSGLAEIIKYGVIADAALFRFLERTLDACLALEPRAVRTMVERSCAIKARVVAQDERETRGARAQLNFGHTLGHALETAGRYRRWTHGEAIAIGMCAAAELGVRAGTCSTDVFERIVRLIGASGLPMRAGRVNPEAVLQAMRYDKKFIRGRQRWVLPTRIGRAMVTDDLSEAVMRGVMLKYLR